MNSRSIISVNPTGSPVGTIKAKDILRHSSLADQPVRVVRKALGVILGVAGSVRHARRLWTFRVIIGAIIMCIGLMLTHQSLHSAADAMMSGVAYAMIAGGAMIACGLLTRIVSTALAAVLIISAFDSGITSMEGYTIAICAAMCLMSLLCGSGRYSLDTLIYNFLAPHYHDRPITDGCSPVRRMRHIP